MYSYPLKFKAGMDPSASALTILDKDKKEILYRNEINEDMQKGKAPCVIFRDKTAGQPLYTILCQEKNNLDSFLIRSADNELIGKLTAETEHAWKVMDEHDNVLATIQEKSYWKKESCLFEVLTFPFDINTRDQFLRIISPHRFLASVNGKNTLVLREAVDYISDDYNLKKKSELSEQQEALLLISLMMVL